jgi:hypothetical protein
MEQEQVLQQVGLGMVVEEVEEEIKILAEQVHRVFVL